MPRSFLVNAAANWLAFAATLGVAFFLTPHLIGGLGKPRYDVWCIVEAVLAYFTLLDMGLAVSLVRHVARSSNGRSSADQLRTSRGVSPLNRMASACLALYAAAGVVALLIGVPLTFALLPRLEARSGTHGDIGPFMLLMIVNLALTLPLSVFPSILDGLERFAAKSIVRIVSLAVRTAGVVWVLNHEAGLLPLAVVFTVTNLIEHAAMAALCFRSLPDLRFAPRHIDRATLRLVKGTSVDAFLAMLAGRVTVQTAAIVIGLLLPSGQVTFFSNASRLVEHAKTLLRTITGTLTPGVSAMEARGDWPGIRALFLNATRWLLYLALPIHLGLWFFGRPFLARWIGPEFVRGSFPALAILSFTLTIGVAQSVASRLLYGLGRLKLFARLALAEAAFNVLLMLSLILPFGIEGVAVAVAVPNVLFCLAVIAMTCRMIELHWKPYLLTWFKPLLAATMAASAWTLIGPVAPTWPSIGRGIAMGLLPYGVVVVLLEGSLPRRKRPRLVESHVIKIAGHRAPVSIGR